MVPSLILGRNVVPLYAVAQLIPPRGPKTVSLVFLGGGGLDPFPFFQPLGTSAGYASTNPIYCSARTLLFILATCFFDFRQIREAQGKRREGYWCQ
jgi:hypothetical protein